MTTRNVSCENAVPGNPILPLFHELKISGNELEQLRDM